MASVLHLVMFMLYTVMLSNNNYLTCKAASAADTIDFECALSIFEIANATIDNPYGPYGGPNFLTAENGSVILNPLASIRQYCGSVPKTKLSGSDLVLCICKVQDGIESEARGNREENPFVKVFNALGTDKNLTKSCGIEDFDCDTAFRSVLTTCEADAREAMKTCAPMVKAAAEKDVGNRGRQHCCSKLKETMCPYSMLRDKKNRNSTQIIGQNKPPKSLNDTLRDQCGLSEAELLNLPACDYRSEDPSRSESETRRANFDRLRGLYQQDLRFCGPTLKNPRMQASDLAVEAKPLVNPFTGCCLKDESCKCDPRSVSCCQKLGNLSKNKRESCMCKLLNSKTTPDSTRDFLNIVRINAIQIRSCQPISSVYTETCVPVPSQPQVIYEEFFTEWPPIPKRKGFRTFNNPDG
ncbi:hypothetical protein vseg_011917 [Gypsophila vaccaria]